MAQIRPQELPLWPVITSFDNDGLGHTLLAGGAWGCFILFEGPSLPLTQPMADKYCHS